MNLKELAEYKKNLDELREFRSIRLTPAQLRLALAGGEAAQRQLTLYQQQGIWPDNVHLFQKVDAMEAAPLPIDLNAGRCIYCGEEITEKADWWVCSRCQPVRSEVSE